MNPASSPSAPRPRRLTIVGGGYSGCTAAVQFAAACDRPIAITILEPRAKLGYGLAYSTDDPDHRLNGSPENHMIHPADADSLQRWYEQRRLLAIDPDARAADGTLFIRRSDFGRYVNEMTQAQADRMGAGSSMRHVCERACDAVPTDTGFRVTTETGLCVESDMVIVATGNAIPRLPSSLEGALIAHPHVVASASDLTRLKSLPSDARVLVLGTGLTALDVLSTLIRARHRGAITAISRRGLRPLPYRPKGLPGDIGQPPVLDRIDGPIAPFVAALQPLRLRGLVRALRQRIRDAAREGTRDGSEWYVAFDQMRDVVWQFWPRMPTQDKRRFARLLRTWYDAHRFRAPPQNAMLVGDAERSGRVTFKAARLHSASWSGGSEPIRVALQDRGTAVEYFQAFDAVINCTGLDASAGAADNPFLASLLRRGLMTADESGVGFAVDHQCRAVDREGNAQASLRVIGPPTAGVFGDPLGALFIAAQVRRILPDALVYLTGDVAP